MVKKVKLINKETDTKNKYKITHYKNSYMKIASIFIVYFKRLKKKVIQTELLQINTHFCNIKMKSKITGMEIIRTEKITNN